MRLRLRFPLPFSLACGALACAALGVPAPVSAAGTPTPAPTRAATQVARSSPVPTLAPTNTPAPTATPQPTPSPTPTQAPTLAPTVRPLAGLWRRTDLVTTPTPAASPTVEPSPTPTSNPEDDWLAFVPTDALDHLAAIRQAEKDSSCGVPWQMLAAIARVESDFGRNMATSSAGAIGYGQFLPSSWEAFGHDGNAYDYHDALPAMARYLCDHGAAQDPRRALWAYNHADWYVDLVLTFAAHFDFMATGALEPKLLDTEPSADAQLGRPLRYAAGRETRSQAGARTSPPGVLWLDVPFRPRTRAADPAAQRRGAPPLAMVLGALGAGSSRLPQIEPAEDSGGELASLANAAWEAGALPMDLLGAGGAYRAWTVEQLRSQVAAGHPVVIRVSGPKMPAWEPLLGQDDRFVVVIGLTPDGVIYHDPAFGSSLGDGLELSNLELQAAWGAASPARQAVAFAPRPAPLPEVDAAAHRAGRGPLNDDGLALGVAPVPLPSRLLSPTPVADAALAEPVALPESAVPEAADTANPEQPTPAPVWQAGLVLLLLSALAFGLAARAAEAALVVQRLRLGGACTLARARRPRS